MKALCYDFSTIVIARGELSMVRTRVLRGAGCGQDRF